MGALLEEYSKEAGVKEQESGAHSSRDRSPNARPCRSRRLWRTSGGHLPDRCWCSCGTTGHRRGRGSSRGGRESCLGLCRFLGNKQGRSAHGAAEKGLLCLKTPLVNRAELTKLVCLLKDLYNQTHGKIRRSSYGPTLVAIRERTNWLPISKKTELLLS